MARASFLLVPATGDFFLSRNLCLAVGWTSLRIVFWLHLALPFFEVPFPFPGLFFFFSRFTQPLFDSPFSRKVAAAPLDSSIMIFLFRRLRFRGWSVALGLLWSFPPGNDAGFPAIRSSGSPFVPGGPFPFFFRCPGEWFSLKKKTHDRRVLLFFYQRSLFPRSSLSFLIPLLFLPRRRPVFF